MTIFVLWVASSALVGWLGRKRIIGFWGFFVLSLVLSPVLTSIFLLLAAPGRNYVADAEKKVAASFRSAGFVHASEARRMKQKANGDVASIVPHAPPTLLKLAEWWVGTLAAFAVAYWVLGANAGGLSLTSGAFGPLDAVRLSFDVGTLGAGSAATGTNLAWLASIERLIVLVLLVLMVSSLISSQMAALQAKREAAAKQEPAPPAPAPTSSIAAARQSESTPAPTA